MTINIHNVYRPISKRFRKRRFEYFLKIIQPSLSDSLLDIGGYPTFWTDYPQCVRRIDTLNLHKVSWHPTDGSHLKYIRTLVGDGCALPMQPQCYNIGFSNSVIEHVGTWENQQKFASEICRVAQSLWVQTPAFECPVEPHYWTPFIHYLPRKFQKKILRWCTLWGWLARPDHKYIDFMVDTTRLLSKSEMKKLFPDCEILTERMLIIFPKSYIAIRGKPRS
jgi:hypothetical protein